MRDGSSLLAMEHGAKEPEGEDPPEHVAPDQHQQDLLDEAIEDSFPASDPPAGPATAIPSRSG